MATLPPDFTESELLQSFFDDVEKLSIHHDACAVDRGIESGGNGDSIIYSDRSDARAAKAANSEPPSSKQSKEKMREMIANAENNRRGWSEFKKINIASTNNNCGHDYEVNREPKISFQIASTSVKDEKKKKKKKSSKTTVEKQQQIITDQEGENHPVGTRHRGFCSSVRTTSQHRRNAVNNDTDHMSFPEWTLIIDTCCLIENNGIDVKGLINLATNASESRIKATQCNTALMAKIVDEPIRIVIPVKVWSELEFQSKSKSPEANIAYAARNAIRMLRDELESEGGVLRSQTLLEARRAGEEYLPKDSKSTNDDHILVCAMMEDERHKNDDSSSRTVAGGVVVVTLDSNLACKAISNGLKVFSPTEFRLYYQKRMCSLQQRALGQLADSALRR